MENTFRRDLPNCCLHNCKLCPSFLQGLVSDYFRSRLQGHEFNRSIYKVLKLWHIIGHKEFWPLPSRLFTIFTSKTCGSHSSATRLISTLHAWKSMRLDTPGDSYVRLGFNCGRTTSNLFALGASMTLIGLLPPLCENGNMLVDGGYSECYTHFDRTPI